MLVIARGLLWRSVVLEPSQMPLETHVLRVPSAGDVVADKYRIEGMLAMGGMAMVLAAVHLGLREPVALKVLLPRFSKGHEFISRFRREARAMACLKSEHVARVLDCGTTAEGAPFLAMELLEGQDLEAIVRAHGPLPQAEAVDLVLQGCEALSEAHALGIVHRDLKPQNFVLTKGPDGERLLKLIDFGIAKTISSRGGLTEKNSSMGTPLYMSPEQLHSSESVDSRADIWALGVVLHELITGKPVFVAPTVAEILVQIEIAEPRVLVEPPELAAIILRCLRANPAERFASVRELAEALIPFGSKGAAARVERLRRVEEAARERGPIDMDVDVELEPELEAEASVVVAENDLSRMTTKVGPAPAKPYKAMFAATILAIVAMTATFISCSRPAPTAHHEREPEMVERVSESEPVVQSIELDDEPTVAMPQPTVASPATRASRHPPKANRDHLFSTRK